MSNQRSKEQLEIFKTIALELLPGIFVLTKEKQSTMKQVDE